RVVDADVELAERVDGRLHHALTAGHARHAVVVRDGLAAERRDLGDDLVGHAVPAAAAAVARAAEIVDDELGALLGERERVAATDAAARAGHERDLAGEQCHGGILLGERWPSYSTS